MKIQASNHTGFLVIAVGVFGLAEIIAHLGRPGGRREVFDHAVAGLWPTAADFRQAWPAVLRGSALGALLGLLPGGGASLASFAAYALEKRVVRQPRVPFGKGAIEGVAGPESANNAGAQASFLPVLTLGIPTNAAMALLVGAMVIKGISPGPQVMTGHPELFWALIASMWVGNVLLLVLNLPLIGLWIRLLAVPYRFLFPASTLLCCVGVYSVAGSSFAVYLAASFAALGYLFHMLGCEPAPLLLGFVLGPMMEENLRAALLLSHGDWSTLATRPVSAGLLLAAALLIVVVSLPAIGKRREIAFADD